MANTVKNWYILSKGKKVGPVSEQNIISFYEQKKITGETKVAKSGMKAWVSLSASGILDTDIDDLPPIPDDENSTKKKSTGTAILAVVCSIVAVVVVIAVISAILSRNGESADSPSSDLAVSDPQENAEMPDPITTENDDEADALDDTQDSDLIALDKVIANEWVSIQIPSSWDYSFDDNGRIDIYPDKENKEDIILIAYVPSRSVYGFITDIHEPEDFVFDDGGVGVFVKPSDDAATFVNMKNDNEAVLDVFTNGSDWYNKNETLINAIARTLTFESASGESPAIDDMYVDNYDYSVEDSTTYFEYTTVYGSIQNVKFDVLKGIEQELFDHARLRGSFDCTTYGRYNFSNGAYVNYEISGNRSDYSKIGDIGLGLSPISFPWFRITNYYEYPETGEAFLHAMDPYGARIIMYGRMIERDIGSERNSTYQWNKLEILCCFHENEQAKFLEIITTFRNSIAFEGEPLKITGDWNDLVERTYGVDPDRPMVGAD